MTDLPRNNDLLPRPWDAFLQQPFEKAHKQTLAHAELAYRTQTVFPPQTQLFSAFAAVAPEDVRVVILGQDPYHEPGQANGLAFSVSKGVKFPPSLRNIFTELCEDQALPQPTSGDLTPWAEQGVLLLNTVLTVQSGAANSHKDIGWQAFTDDVIAALSKLPQPIAFILWGAQAQAKLPLIECGDHPRLILQSPHPSPLSAYRGFFGSKPFSQINEFLERQGQMPINWRLP